MGIFDIIFGKNKSTDQVNQCGTNKLTEDAKQTPKHYRKIASQNADLVEGMQFHVTCQLCTPLAVFKMHGEVYIGEGFPPTYGSPQDGVWTPKLDSEYDFLAESRTCSSDAGPVIAEEYIDYAIGLLSIFESDKTISEKMTEAISYAENSESKRQIERGILTCYRESSIADVMARYITESERFEYYLDKPRKLTLVNGVNNKIESALEGASIQTIKELSCLTEDDLLKIKGIGKVSAQKIIAHLSGVL
ncbi:helix-hairpin-helix domain-containing protein [Shewanella japonica]|uniref:helix-hairpin-helix domain-containing protein n=1 Tax=Shewanella japonica TaxID=93973 RepID=UPI002493F53E|nr:helix-hairpin-helix domain-containing protein [Shewanella japonica]